jgi:glycosyltransferase involved in cell wall biosynthesis
MNNFRLTVEGWRGVNHSFAMVNQNQLLVWAQDPDVELFHVDAPLYQAHWAAGQLGAGFRPEEEQLLRDIPAPGNEPVDAVYRIHAPLPSRVPRLPRTRQVTFMVTEFGLTAKSFADGEPDLASFTDGGNAIVTPSRWSRDRLAEFGFDPAGIHVLRHGVRRQSFHPASADERREARRRLNWHDEHFVFANVGVATWNKGIDILIAAFATLRKSHPHVRLVLKDHAGLYGMGVDQTMRKVAQANPGLLTQDVLDSIALISGNLSQQQLRALYICADCYVSPYRAEGFNLPVLEAIACGTPVIVTAGGATDDFCDGPWATRVEGQPRQLSRDGLDNGSYVELDVDRLTQVMALKVQAQTGHDRLQGPAWEAHIARMGWETAADEVLDHLTGTGLQRHEAGGADDMRVLEAA